MVILGLGRSLLLLPTSARRGEISSSAAASDESSTSITVAPTISPSPASVEAIDYDDSRARSPLMRTPPAAVRDWVVAPDEQHDWRERERERDANELNCEFLLLGRLFLFEVRKNLLTWA